MIQIFWEVTPCAWFVKGDTYTIGLLSMRLVQIALHLWSFAFGENVWMFT